MVPPKLICGCADDFLGLSFSQCVERLGGVVASRQSRAGQLIQPADPWICTQNSKNRSSCQLLTRVSWQECPGAGCMTSKEKSMFSVPSVQRIGNSLIGVLRILVWYSCFQHCH